MRIKINILESQNETKIKSSRYINLIDLPVLKDNIMIENIRYKLSSRTYFDDGSVEINIFEFNY